MLFKLLFVSLILWVNVCSQTGQPLLLMAEQTIPLHDISSSVGTDTMGNYECYLILNPSEEAVITYMIAPENMWMGVGFGTTQMEGSIAYIYSRNTESGEFEIWEYALGNHFIDRPRKQINSYQVQTMDGYTTVMLRRPFNGNPGEYDFSVYDNNLKYIMAAGTSDILGYHDMGFKANWIGLSTLPPPTMQPTYEPTEQPTLMPSYVPTLNPTNMPSILPTESPTKDPTESPTMKPTNNPSANPTVQPTITEVRGRDTHGIFERGIDIDVERNRVELPQINVHDFSNNECALDVVFVVDTSVYITDECAIQSNYIQSIMYAIIDKNKDKNIAKFSIITFNDCSTTVQLSINDDWMNTIDSINFCKNDIRITNDIHCDACLDAFSLGMQQFSLASPNKKVLMFITNSECYNGICTQWDNQHNINLKDTETWIYNIGNSNQPILINDLDCVADYTETYQDPLNAYTRANLLKFISKSCVNTRRQSNMNDNINIDIVNRPDIFNRPDRFNRDVNFRTDEERFGRNEDRFNNDFFQNNQQRNRNNNNEFFNGDRPNQGFFSRLENGGLIQPQIGSFNHNNNVNDNPGGYGDVYIPNQGNTNSIIGRPNALAGDVVDKEEYNDDKDGSIYQNELRDIAYYNKDHVLSRTDAILNKMQEPKAPPKGNIKGGWEYTETSSTMEPLSTTKDEDYYSTTDIPYNKGPPNELLSRNDELQYELKERNRYMQDHIMYKRDNIKYPYDNKGDYNNNITGNDTDYYKSNKGDWPGYTGGPYTKGWGMNTDRDSDSMESNMTTTEYNITEYNTTEYTTTEHTTTPESGYGKGKGYNKGISKSKGYGRPYPEPYTRDYRDNMHSGKGKVYYNDNAYPEPYLRDHGDNIYSDKGMQNYNRELPDYYTNDYDYKYNLKGYKGYNDRDTNMQIDRSVDYPEFKGKDIHDMYPERY